MPTSTDLFSRGVTKARSGFPLFQSSAIDESFLDGDTRRPKTYPIMGTTCRPPDLGRTHALLRRTRRTVEPWTVVGPRSMMRV